jgi:predicted dehydrogenase
MPMRWAIVGSGQMADGIAAAIDRTPDAELTVIVGRTMDSAARLATHRGGRPADDLVAALGKDVDAVYVGSPNAFHHEHARRALLAGKHVLVDKPAATTLPDARDLVATADAVGLVLAVNLQGRHHPGLGIAREWIADQVIGRPVVFRASLAFGPEALEGWRADPSLAGAAALYNLGVHAIDMVLAIADEPAMQVLALTSPAGEPLDRTSILLVRLRSGAVATILASQELDSDEVVLEVVGTRARLAWSGWMAPYRRGRISVSTAEGPTRTVDVECPDAYERVVADVMEAARTGRPPAASGAALLETVAVTEAARDSARLARAIDVHRS